MSTRKHVHREEFATSPAQLFDLLLTPSAIQQWWNAARAIVIPQQRGTWVATWGEDEDDPDYITAATIRELDPPRRLVLGDFQYHAKSGPLPFDAEFLTEFIVEPTSTGGASLQVTQEGFPGSSDADEYYSACEKGWVDTFAGIRAYLDESA